MLTKLTSEEAQARLKEIRERYSQESSINNFSALIQGLPGSGKTSLAATGRLPVLIDSFDPLNTLVLRDEVKKGDVVVRAFWNESSKNPTEYGRWEKMWDKDTSTGFIGMFGTYVIDSTSTWIDCLTWEYCRRKGRANNMPEIQDYPIIYNIIKDHIKISATQGADFILTAHLIAYQDEISGRTYSEIDTYKKLKSRIPLLFTEKYVTTAKEVPKTKENPSGIKHVLLTSAAGRYNASTQLGKNGIFDAEEEPNIKALLKKAGLSTEDKKI
jgi:hypothetical protein